MRHDPFRSAFDTTARGMSLLGKPRALQWVHVSERVFRGGECVRIIVTVIPGMSEPDGKAMGTRYIVRSAAALEALRNGETPEELELEPYDGPDESPDEYADPAEDRADEMHQRMMEAR